MQNYFMLEQTYQNIATDHGMFVLKFQVSKNCSTSIGTAACC